MYVSCFCFFPRVWLKWKCATFAILICYNFYLHSRRFSQISVNNVQLDHPTKKLSTSNARQLISTNKQSLKIRKMFNFSHLVLGIQQFLSLHYRPFIRAQCSIQMLHFKAFLKPEINYMIRQSKECLDWNVEIVLLLYMQYKKKKQS